MPDTTMEFQRELMLIETLIAIVVRRLNCHWRVVSAGRQIGRRFHLVHNRMQYLNFSMHHPNSISKKSAIKGAFFANGKGRDYALC